VSWQLVYTRQAQKDAKKLASAGLKGKAEKLLAILARNPYESPPPFEKLVGDLLGRIRAGSTSSIDWSMRSWTTCTW
jgi:Txe/YoeB family toxin of Txe-Axe toxin-antitoxin module